MEKKHYKLVTHNLSFHADDVFACAILGLVIEKAGGTWEVKRTRDVAEIDSADIVFDVGGIHDSKLMRFDHHQKGGAGPHADGTPLASCGLVWAQFGMELAIDPRVYAKIEKELIEPIDAEDVGISLVTPLAEIVPVTLQAVLYASRATWKEDLSQNDAGFLEQVSFAQKLLMRMIKVTTDIVSGEGLAEVDYNNAADKRLILTEGNYPVSEFLESKPEPLYIVRQNTDGSGWRVLTVRKFPHSFENRKDFPLEWAGLRDEEFEKVSGVLGAVFCHNGRWLVVAKTKEAALKLADMALVA